VAAVSNTADRSFTLRIGVLHWSGKPGWLLPVTCGRPAIVQRAYRFTGFQLGVKSMRASICCLPRREIAGSTGRCRPASSLNRYLLALPADRD
jgi:hypothetical protein